MLIEYTSLPIGQQQARSRWGTQASGEAFLSHWTRDQLGPFLHLPSHPATAVCAWDGGIPFTSASGSASASPSFCLGAVPADPLWSKGDKTFRSISPTACTAVDTCPGPPGVLPLCQIHQDPRCWPDSSCDRPSRAPLA